MNSAEVVVVDDMYADEEDRARLLEFFEDSGHSIVRFLSSLTELDSYLEENTPNSDQLVFWMDGDLNRNSSQQVIREGYLVDAPDDIRNRDGADGILKIREKWPNSPPVIVGRAGRGEVHGADHQASKSDVSNFAFINLLSEI